MNQHFSWLPQHAKFVLPWVLRHHIACLMGFYKRKTLWQQGINSVQEFENISRTETRTRIFPY
jgi:hypothetical protein